MRTEGYVIVSNLDCVTEITYIMYNVQDYSVLYNNADRPVICQRGILPPSGKHLADYRIIALRGEVWTHKTGYLIR